MISSVKAYINKHKLLTEHATVVVGVSGGRDSVALLLILNQLGYKVLVAHCNFQLREKDSNDDEIFVQQLSERLHLPFKVIRFNTLDYAQEHHLSIQEAARVLRYDWFETLRADYRAETIAVGHHLDDQIETFFIHLLRGSGIRGLKGMMPHNGNIIRPLLFVPRTSIEDFLQAQNQDYREDESNSQTKYLRNNIRHNLMPAFNMLKDSAYESLVQSLNLLQQDFMLLENWGQEKIKTLVVPTADGYRIARSALENQDIIEPLLYTLLRDFGFKGSVITAVAQAVQGQSGTEFYSLSHRLTIARDHLFIQPILQKQLEQEFWIEAADTFIQSPVELQFESIEREGFTALKQPPEVALLDLSLVPFPLRLRSIREGDRFQPFGMKGSKLVSDFLTDRHIPRHEKEKCMLLETMDGTIVWLIGQRIDARFAVTENTKTIWRIELKPPS